MRQVCLCTVLCALSAVALSARSARSQEPSNVPPLTIVIDFHGAYSQRAVEEMEREVEGIMRAAGRLIEWRTWEQASQATFDELTVVRFYGDCGVPPWPAASAEGPLGSTYISDGTVLPFSDIACDRIATSVRSAILRVDREQAEILFGRAMGRVVAHELVHMVSRSAAHGHEGVTQPALSESDLTRGRLELSPKDMIRLFGPERQ